MLNLKPRLAIMVLLAVLATSALTFAPVFVEQNSVSAESCQPGWTWGSWTLYNTWRQCVWDAGCFINPTVPDGEYEDCKREYRHAYDTFGVCDTEWRDICNGTGNCCNY